MPQLDLQTLESWLWDSANILRGSIDSSDFKNYIFGLLYLRCLNHVFEGEADTKVQHEGIASYDAPIIWKSLMTPVQ
jgi:type I restriction enzyme M protein